MVLGGLHSGAFGWHGSWMAFIGTSWKGISCIVSLEIVYPGHDDREWRHSCIEVVNKAL